MRLLVCLLVLCSFLSAGPAAADGVKLKDGTTLLGTINGMTEGTLQFEASFGGSLSIPWAQVVSLESAKAIALTMNDGKQQTGTLTAAEGAQSITIDKAGESPLQLGDVTAIMVEGQALAAKKEPAGSEPDTADPAMAEPGVAEVTAAVEAVNEKLGAEAPPAPAAPEAEAPTAGTEVAAAEPEKGKVWAGRAELGLNGQTGNKERFDVRAGIDMNRKTEKWRMNLYLKGQYAETNSEQSANEVMGGTRIEVDFSPRTYVFGKLDLERDEFEDLELRATLTSGFGHYFVKREKLELKGWLGAGYEYERFRRDPEPIPDDLPTPTTLEESVRQILLLTQKNDDLTTTMNEVVAEAGYSYQQDFKKNFRFKHGITYYPSVDDPFSEYRLMADTGLEFPLGKDPDWTLRAGVRNEFDAKPQEDVDRLDTTYYLNLGYNW